MASPPFRPRVITDNEASDFALALQEWGTEFHLCCLRENPLNSLHALARSGGKAFDVNCGDWTDLDYDACVFLGARSSNLPELTMLPSLRCGHFRSPDEWPRTSDAVFPTFAEAEYTPSLVFTIAVAATAWARKTGWGCEPIPRLPPIHTTDDVRGLLAFPPEALCSDLTLVHDSIACGTSP